MNAHMEGGWSEKMGINERGRHDDDQNLTKKKK